jgi:hypothetical protein
MGTTGDQGRFGVNSGQRARPSQLEHMGRRRYGCRATFSAATELLRIEILASPDKEAVMDRRPLVVFALLPMALVLAAEQSASIPTIKVDRQDVAIDDLAHSFFLHSSMTSRENLETIISADGAARLQPVIAEHIREMGDIRNRLPDLQQACTSLQRAHSGQEFAAVVVRLEAQEEENQRQAARQILSRLDVNDRSALEFYLDTKYRHGLVRSRIDWHAMFASAPFPSEWSNTMVKRICDAAALIAAPP